MPRAKLAMTPDQPIDAVDYEKEKHGPVVCIDCRCQVRHVHTYARNVDDEQITVLAYFRLAPGVDHGPKCRYSVEKTIRRFVAYSRAVEDLDQNATPILDKIGRGQAAEFRLHILMNAIQAASARPQSRPESLVKYVRQKQDKDPTGTDYIPTRRVLKPYFRTTKGILLVAARLQAHSDLAAWITLKFGDQTIHWDEFFFHLEQYDDLYESLSLEKQRNTGMYPRPVAIVTKIQDDHTCDKRGSDWRVNGRFRVIKTKGGKTLAVRPVMYFNDVDLGSRVAKESFVLVCGIPRLGHPKIPQKPRLKEQVDISISVVNAGQVCRYNLT